MSARRIISELITCVLADAKFTLANRAEDDDAAAVKLVEHYRGLPQRWSSQSAVSAAQTSALQLAASFEYGSAQLKEQAAESTRALTAPPAEGGYGAALDDGASVLPPAEARRRDEWYDATKKEQQKEQQKGGGARATARWRPAPTPGANAKALQSYQQHFVSPK
eukprot:gene18198-47051_t